MENSQVIRRTVEQRYAEIAQRPASSCCGKVLAKQVESAIEMGYSEQDLQAVPEGSNLGLGCGNPGAIASLRSGETVLDLGSGAGFDCFLAARQVGERGRVIGVDMTREMLDKAERNSRRQGFANVEFRLGEIEQLPVADDTVDVIISNCVINLSPEKEKVFREAWRVLKPGGRLAVADIVAHRPLPEEVRRDAEKYCGCVAGAASIEELEKMLTNAGFSGIAIEAKANSKKMIKDWFPASESENYVVSADIKAVKPASKKQQATGNMDERTQELIAIGASVAAHCQPCLTFHVNRAAGLCIDEEEIQQAVKIGQAVNQGATAAIMRHVRETIANRERPACCTGQPETEESAVADHTSGSSCCGSGDAPKQSACCS